MPCTLNNRHHFTILLNVSFKKIVNKGVLNMSVQWEKAKDYQEIKYEKYNGVAKVTMNRPEVHNAFTPLTVNEMIDAFADARDDSSIGVIVLTGEGDKAFCS